MIFDTDDFHERNHRLDLLEQLHNANPSFKMTAFAVPKYCSPDFVATVPDWIELVGHGWDHGGWGCPDAYEASNWSYEQAMDVLLALPGRFADGWKSPGWQISDGTYLALEELGWWVADQHLNDARRPATLRVHCADDGEHVHTHVQNVCSNGLEERFDEWLSRVESATDFQFVSEAVSFPLLETA